MSTLADQLELAAKILREPVPFERRRTDEADCTWHVAANDVALYLGEIVNGHYEIRLKPWTLRDHIAKHFRPLRDGEVPHREDFTEEMLSGEWRPLLRGEKCFMGDTILMDRTWCLQDSGQLRWESPCNHVQAHQRTKRPLPTLRKRVPLCAEDCPPGSVFRRPIKRPDIVWWAPEHISTTSVQIGDTLWMLEELERKGFEIKRPGEDWQAASKEVDA